MNTWIEKTTLTFTTFDGVEVPEGTEVHWTVVDSSDEVIYLYTLELHDTHKRLITSESYYKIFSSKEIADLYVEAANTFKIGDTVELINDFIMDAQVGSKAVVTKTPYFKDLFGQIEFLIDVRWDKSNLSKRGGESMQQDGGYKCKVFKKVEPQEQQHDSITITVGGKVISTTVDGTNITINYTK